MGSRINHMINVTIPCLENNDVDMNEKEITLEIHIIEIMKAE